MSLSGPSFPSRRSAAPVARRRHRPAGRRRASPAGGRTPTLAAEALERRALLAVTASLVGTDLQIALGAADDVAYLSNDGTNYIVRGTQLSGYTAANAAVNSVSVAGTAAANQAFTVVAGVGAVLTDSLSVAASVESTTVVGAINAAGAVTIGSGAITLAADVTTTGKQDYQGNVGLVGSRTLSAGTGDVAFGGTVDSSALLFADPDAFAAGTPLTNAYPEITLSAVGTKDTGTVVTSGPTSSLYAPTGSQVFLGKNSDGAWNAPENVLKAAFNSPVSSVSVDAGYAADSEGTSYLSAYDAGGNLVASSTHVVSIPKLVSATWTFYTDDDDKDLNDVLALTLYDKNSQVVASEADLAREVWPDFTTHQLSLSIPAGTITKEQMIGGTVRTAMSGNDGEWRFHATISLVYSDGTTSTESIPYSQWDGQGTSDQTVVADQPYTPPAAYSSLTLSVSAPSIAYVLTSFDPVSTSVQPGYIDNLRATLATTPAADLTVNSSGTTTFGGAVGGSAALANLSTDALGLTLAAGGAITTTNDQIFKDAYFLKTDTTLTSNNNGRIAFLNTVDSYDATYRALTVNTGGSTEFGDGGADYVGNTNRLLSLTTDDAGSTYVWINPSSCAQPSIQTQAAQTYNDDVVIKAATVFHFNTGTTTFKKTLSGGNYAVSTYGHVEFLGAVNIGSFAQCDASTVDLNGGAFTTTGDQVFNGDVVLTANATQTSGGDVDFKKKVNGAYTLTIDATKAVYFRGTVGDATPLAGISLTAATSVTASETIKLDGTTPRAGGTPTPFADGLTIYPNVNNVSFTKAGSEIRDFEGSGIVFLGDSTASTLGGFTIYANKQNGIVVNKGNYTGTAVQGNQIGSPTLAFTAAAGGSQLTFAGDQTGVFFANQAVALKSATTGCWVMRTVTAVSVSGGNTRVTLSAAIDATTTSGVAVVGNLGNGISLNAAGGTISNLTIGGNASKYGNSITANTQDGILVGTGTYTGTTIGSFNEITLNNQNGIELASGGATSLAIVGNSVGTLADGTSDRGNRLNGIEVNKGTYTGTTIRTNTIAFNLQDGISLSPAGGSITGLTIGGDKTTATSQGNAIYGNGSDGIEADAGTYTTTVIQGNTTSSPSLNYTVAAGGTQVTVTGDQRCFFEIGQAVVLEAGSPSNTAFLRTATAVALSGGNTIVTLSSAIDVVNGKLTSGNIAHGINLNAAGGALTNLVVGAGPGGSSKFGNQLYANTGNGILVGTGTYTNTVIGDLNEITLNGQNGVELATGGAIGLTVRGNFIGTSGGLSNRGNRLDGILVRGGTSTSAGITGNYIAYNVDDGINLGGNVLGLTINRNRIAANGSDGIEATKGSSTATVIDTNTTESPSRAYTQLAGGAQISLTGDLRRSFVVNQAVVLNPGTTTDAIRQRTISAVSYNGTNTILTLSQPIDVGSGNLTIGNVKNGIALDAAGGAITSLRITGNDVKANTLDGILVTNGDYTGTEIRTNSISFNHLNGIYLNATGGSLMSLLIGGDPAATRGNEIYRNGTTTGGNGIATTVGDLAGTTIVGNTIRDNGLKSPAAPQLTAGNGILVQGKNLMIGWRSDAGLPNTVANTITGNALNGIEVRGAAATSNTILSNSIYLNGYVESVPGKKTVVGEGIALTDVNGQTKLPVGNDGQVAPTILRVVDDATDGVLRVHVSVPAAGKYYVQLFENTVADERSIFPVDTNGFEGRTYVADSPAQANTPVTTVAKPAIAGELVDGNSTTPTIIQIPAGRRTPGNWLTATATLVDNGTRLPGNTSPFSQAVLTPNAPVLAVGSDGPSAWSQAFSYQVINPQQILATTTIARSLQLQQLRTVGPLDNLWLLLTPTNAAAGGNLSMQVLAGVETTGGMLLTLGGSGLPTGSSGTFVIGAATLPAARLYDASARNTILPYTVVAGGTQLVLAGDQSQLISSGQTLNVNPTTPASGETVFRTVSGVTVTGGNTLVTINAPVTPTNTAGDLVIDSITPLLDIGADRISKALTDAGIAPNAANAFVNRYQGGLRVTSGDLDGDGFADLATAPGATPAVTLSAISAANSQTLTCSAGSTKSILVGMAVVGPGIPANTLVAAITSGPTADTVTLSNAATSGWQSTFSFSGFGNVFDDTPRIVTIYNGNKDATAWTSASVNVSGVFGSLYSGGFLVTLGNVRPENAGSGSAVAELVVASTDKVAVFEVTVAARGGQPTIASTPVAHIPLGSYGKVTGLAAGDFSSADSDEVVVATNVNGVTTVRTFAVDKKYGGDDFMLQRTFDVRSVISIPPFYATPSSPPVPRTGDVFAQGASLAVGDIDGRLTLEASQPRLKPELVLGASTMGWGNFRVLANGLVAGGSQTLINQALTLPAQNAPGTPLAPIVDGPNVYTNYTDYSRAQYWDGKNWQPAGADYFGSIGQLPPTSALGATVPLTVAVVDADGKTNSRSEVFAALGASNATNNTIRRISWNGSATPGRYAWTSAATLVSADSIVVRPATTNGTNVKTRFPLGFGLRLG